MIDTSTGGLVLPQSPLRDRTRRYRRRTANAQCCSRSRLDGPSSIRRGHQAEIGRSSQIPDFDFRCLHSSLFLLMTLRAETSAADSLLHHIRCASRMFNVMKSKSANGYIMLTERSCLLFSICRLKMKSPPFRQAEILRSMIEHDHQAKKVLSFDLHFPPATDVFLSD